MDGSEAEPLIRVALEHNPLVAKKLAVAIGEELPTSWTALGARLGQGNVMEQVLSGYAGNSSEKLVLAALLSKAGYAHQSDKLCPAFFNAWGGLDPFNRGLVADILADEGE